MIESVLTAVLDDANVWQIDLDSAIAAASDKVWFTIKRKFTDADVDAVRKYGLNVGGGLTGITAVSDPLGQVNVTSPAGDLPGTLTDKVLVFDVQVQRSGSVVTTVARGHIRLLRGATQTTV